MMCLPDDGDCRAINVNKSVANLNPYFIKTSGEGESLIVIHGWGMNSSVWESVRLELESQFKVSWIDLPGHGHNKGITAQSMDEIVDLILPHITDGAHLLGWSLGGLVAQALAEKTLVEKKKQSFKSITLVASTPRFSQAENWENAMSLNILDNFSMSLKKDLEGTLKRFISLQFMGIKESKRLQRDLTNGIQSALPNTSALELGLQLLAQSDYRFSANKTPQHWILAEKDRLIPLPVINDLKLLRPDDQISILKNSGHAPFMTHPKEFMEAFSTFVNQYA